MTANASRYPGVQPFLDNSLARSTFFGRHQEINLLKAQVTAARLTVVYANSGIGKTSLLSAGLHHALREDGFLPLMVRLNDLEKAVIDCILDPLAELAQYQTAEIVEGSRRSLWHYFKTVEFWNEDVLLKPVLILDQFEELFTLRNLSDQTKLLQELGHVIRGDAPCNYGDHLGNSLRVPGREQKLTMAFPSVNVIISLREDFLGMLDDASFYMPSILSNRFRLRPLSMAAAYEALSAPSQLRNAEFKCREFTIDTVLLNCIISLLSGEASMLRNPVEMIDPFQLQLICQQIEEHVILRQKRNPSYNIVTLQDIGGSKQIKKGIQSFYAHIVSNCCDDLPFYVGIFRRSLIKKRVHNLCTKHLVSPEGRRLALNEETLLRRFRIPPTVLARLVDSRLLRSHQRSNNTYYEISHDTIAEQIHSKPSNIYIRVQQFLLLLALITLAALLFILAFAFWYDSLMLFWGRSESLPLFHLPRDKYYVAIFLEIWGLAATYQFMLACWRRTDYLNRLTKPREKRMATLEIESLQTEPYPLGLLVDSTLQTIALMKNKYILALLVVVWLPVNIMQVRASFLDSKIFGYSDFQHPFTFALFHGAAFLTYASVAYVIQRKLSHTTNPSTPNLPLKTILIATLKTYPLTGMWIMLSFLLYGNYEIRPVQGVWSIVFWMPLAIACYSVYRNLYLGCHYALSPIRLGKALRDAPKLLNYNRWSALTACLFILYSSLFGAVVLPQGDLNNQLSDCDLLINCALRSLGTSYAVTWMLIWLYTALFLGYLEARDNWRA